MASIGLPAEGLHQKKFELLKHKLRKGFGGDRLTVAFKRFKVTLCHKKDSVDFKGFKRALRELNMEITAQDAKEMFEIMDPSGDGLLSFDEFQKFLFPEGNTGLRRLSTHDWRRQSAQQRSQRLALFENRSNVIRTPTNLYHLMRQSFVDKTRSQLSAFRKLMTQSGSSDTFIDLKEFKRAIRVHGFNCAAFVPERLFAHLDPDGNGQITIQEFTQGFFERDLSDDYNLDLPPQRRIKRVGTAKEKTVSLNAPDTPGGLVKQLKAEICTLDSEKLQRNFRRFRCDVFEKAMHTQSVDLRGLKKALESCGCTTLDRAALKGLFFAIDDRNQGYISFNQLASFVGMVIKSKKPVWGGSKGKAFRHTWAHHSRKPRGQINRNRSRKRVSYMSQKQLPRLMLVTGQNTGRRRPSSSTAPRYAFT